jgi:hypothetical protein
MLSEIGSHILEKTEQEYGQVTEASLSKVIAAYGPARRVAEKYLDGRPVIAPVYHLYLFRRLRQPSIIKFDTPSCGLR